MLYATISVIILFFLASVIGLDYLWGINNWGYFGIPLTILYASAGILLINKTSFNKFDSFLDNIKIGKKESFIILTISLLLFILLKQSNYFLGDGYLRIKNAEALQYFSSGSPLGNYFTILLYDKIFKTLGYSALFVWQIISYLSGILSLVIFYYYGKKLFPDNKEFVMGGLLIFLSPLTLHYFGYVESYTLYFVFLLGYYLSTLLMLRSGKYSLNPAIWLIFAFFISPTAVIFSPAILYAYYTISYKDNLNKEFIINFLKPILLVISITILIALFLYSMGFTSDEYTGGLTRVDHILGLFASSTDQGIIDLSHWNDILNQVFLVAPGFIILFFVKLKGMSNDLSKIIKFLFTSLAAALTFMLIFRADISFVRDWDLFSIVAYPIIFLILSTTILSDTKNKYALYLAIVLGFLQTAPWIILNSNENMSLNRMMSISNIEYLPSYAKSNNYDILRQYYKQGIEINNPSSYVIDDSNREKIDKSLYYTKLAYNFEKNERYLYNIALYHFIRKEIDSAEIYLNLMINSKSDSKYLAHTLLSKLLIDKGKIDKAIEQLKKVEEFFPKSETVKLDIATLYYNSGQPRNSYDYFKQAFAINDENDYTLDYLIELSYITDTKDITIDYYRKYDKIKPGNPATYYNMALCFKELGKIDSLNYYANLAKKAGIADDILNKLKEN